MKVYLAWYVYTHEYNNLIGVYSDDVKAAQAVKEYLSKNPNQSGYLLKNKRVDTLHPDTLHLWSDSDEGKYPWEYASVDSWDIE